MKKLAFALLCMACVGLMASCGNKSANEKKAEEGIAIDEAAANEIVEQLDLPEDGIQGYTGDAATDLKNVTPDNYLEIAKGIYGVDASGQEGWEFVEAKSPNKVNNLIVKYNVPGLDEAAVAEMFYNRCIEVADNGVYPMKMDFNTGAMTRGPKCDTYADYLQNKSLGNMWCYEYKGQPVMLTISTWKEQLEINYCLTSN